MIHLDTHVVAWLFAGRIDLLSEEARLRIEGEALEISPMVALELQYLHELGRTTQPGRVVVTDLGQRIGLTVSASPFHEVIVAAEQQTWTRDPFDRIIVGQASVEDAVLVTKDRDIRARYSSAVW